MAVRRTKTGRKRHKPLFIKGGLFRKPKVVMVLEEEWHEEGYIVTDGYG